MVIKNDSASKLIVENENRKCRLSPKPTRMNQFVATEQREDNIVLKVRLKFNTFFD